MPLYDEEADEVIRFVVDFYRANTYPKELLVPAGVDVELLESVLECKVVHPEKGNKADLVKMAIENAKEMLESTDKTIGEISQDVGCFDSSHLSKKFRSKYGISPKEYRKQKQNSKKYTLK